MMVCDKSQNFSIFAKWECVHLKLSVTPWPITLEVVDWDVAWIVAWGYAKWYKSRKWRSGVIIAVLRSRQRLCCLRCTSRWCLRATWLRWCVIAAIITTMLTFILHSAIFTIVRSRVAISRISVSAMLPSWREPIAAITTTRPRWSSIFSLARMMVSCVRLFCWLFWWITRWRYLPRSISSLLHIKNILYPPPRWVMEVDAPCERLLRWRNFFYVLPVLGKVRFNYIIK